ncbi:MAG: hypothetical protein ACK5LJ_10040 [Paracoccus sp. (in: a-proteobacteria)]
MNSLNEETYKDYPFDWLYERTGNPDDRASDVFFMLIEMARQGLENRDALDRAIERIGVHMTLGSPFPPMIGQVALEKLRDSKDAEVWQKLVNHANDWDVDRQMNFFDRIAPLDNKVDDRILYRQIQLHELVEKYGFVPKFEVLESDFMPGYPQYYPADM